MSRSNRTLPGARSLLAFGALVAAIATAGSLYFSLGLGLVPCRLCWYQRILMYPLVIVFGVAALERRGGVYRTTLPLTCGGALIALYHSWLQLAGGAQCAVGVGCAAVQYRVLYLTIPNLSLLAFGILTVVGLALWYGDGTGDR